MLPTLRYASLALFGVVVLLFVDAPFRTVGQKFVVARTRQRLILLSFELDLVALWALAVFVFHWERRLAPSAGAETLAFVGMLAALAGGALAAWAKLRLGRWFSGTFGIKQGHELVTDGPYAITRHPMYTGLLLMVIGAGLAWNSLATLALGILLAAPFFLHTVYEEALFEEHFGAAYLEYQSRVPRLVPFVGPRGPRGAGAI